MVSKIISGKNIQGALNYNEKKVAEGKAELIQANGFLKDHLNLNFYEKLKMFTNLNERNIRSRTNTIHVSLNFDASERLDTTQLNEIASSYMTKIGFDDQPYLVYRHDDSAHPHVHIVSTLIQQDGKRIPIHYLGKNQSEIARKEIEKEFGLVQATGHSKELKSEINPIPEKAVYGKTLTKSTIVKVVRSITKNYRYTSLAELNAVLRLYNVNATRGSEKSQMFLKKGLQYHLIDAKGNPVGIPIKASAIPGKPTLPYLEKQFKVNEAIRQKFKEPLKRVIDAALTLPVIKTRHDFARTLDGQNIKVIFRTNAEGRTYGLTFVDNARKVVLNGSDLGKGYGATGILERISVNADLVSMATTRSYSTNLPDDINAQSVATSPAEDTNPALPDIIQDLAKAESDDFTSPENALKLRKKRKKKPTGS
jgi:hypothetical protein